MEHVFTNDIKVILNEKNSLKTLSVSWAILFTMRKNMQESQIMNGIWHELITTTHNKFHKLLNNLLVQKSEVI